MQCDKVRRCELFTKSTAFAEEWRDDVTRLNWKYSRSHEIRTILSFDFISSASFFFCFHFFFLFPFGLMSFTEWKHCNSAYVNSSYDSEYHSITVLLLLFVPFIDWEEKLLMVGLVKHWTSAALSSDSSVWLTTTCLSENSTFISIVPWLRYCLLIARNGMQLIRKWFQVLNYLRPFLLRLLSK